MKYGVRGRVRVVTAFSLVALLGLGGSAQAHDGKHPRGAERSQAANAANDASVEVKLLDTKLLDRNGRSMRFRSEVIGDRIVIMNFVYTGCTTVCPVSSAIFGQLQQRLGPRLGEEVFLVSMSVDPVTDSPARLRSYAQKHHADPAWIWLTGTKPDVDKVLEGLGAYAPNYTDHPAMTLVGDGRTGRWTRFFGFPGPEELMTKVDALLAARTGSVSAAAHRGTVK